MSSRLDGGRPFDWGRAAGDYAEYRDLYPQCYYDTVAALGVGSPGQRVLDLGTGTGVLPRHLQSRGGHWTGIDISPAQIVQARRLSAAADIEYLVSRAEDLPFADGSFDAATAAQCFFYFDHESLAPALRRLLRPSGRLLVTYLSWLPGEDPLARASEELVLRHNPAWSGGGEVFRPVEIPPQYAEGFRLLRHTEERWALPFTRETWHGRMRACRGTGASMSPEELGAWEAEHRQFLAGQAPEFTVLHCFALALLEKI